MATTKKAGRLLAWYLIFYIGFYLAATVAAAIYLSVFSGDTTGSGIGVLFALPIMFVLYSIMYFFVPGSTLLALFFLGDFALKDRGAKVFSIALSLAIALAVWLATFPVAISLINLVYSGNSFLMIQDSSWPFIYLQAGTNLAGLISAVLWVKLRPRKLNSIDNRSQ